VASDAVRDLRGSWSREVVAKDETSSVLASVIFYRVTFL
jgi:hypothetical protein